MGIETRDTGKLKWHCDTDLTGNITPSVVAEDGVAYVFGGYQGKGQHGDSGRRQKTDVTDSHVVWTSRISSYVPSPIVHDGRIWCVGRSRHRHLHEDGRRRGGVQAATGRRRRRVHQPAVLCFGRDGGRAAVRSQAEPRGRSSSPRRRSSSNSPATRLLPTKAIFNATPAVADGCLFLRSNESVYCVWGEVARESVALAKSLRGQQRGVGSC